MSGRRTPTLRDAAALVARRYNALAALDAHDLALISDLPGPVEEIRRGQDLQTEGAPTSAPRFLVSGWACRFRLLGDGRRMIVAFVLPGDGIGVCRHLHPLALTNVTAITDCGTVHAGPMFSPGGDLSAHKSLDVALRAAASLDEAWLIDAAVRLGRQTAFERMAHLLLELHWRLSHVGLTEEWRFNVPLTQDVLADAVGLSVVHVNRTVQQLRRDRLVEWRHQAITILEPKLLTDIAEFKPPRATDWAR